MPPGDRIHELLPWYMAGTLEPDEADEFRRHLTSCEACRTEMDLIAKLRDELDRHGEALLEDHPPAERLVALVRCELSDEDATRTRRHVALCAACATEASWIGGVAAASAPSSAPRPGRAARIGMWGWVAAAAAVLLLVLQLPAGRQPRTGVVESAFVRAVERAGTQPNVFAIPPAQDLIPLIFEVDLPTASFPATIEIRDEAGNRIQRHAGIAQGSLLEGLYLVVVCARSECPAGRYVARLSEADGSQPGLTFYFELRQP